jgi:hypothetical protein
VVLYPLSNGENDDEDEDDDDDNCNVSNMNSAAEYAAQPDQSKLEWYAGFKQHLSGQRRKGG